MEGNSNRPNVLNDYAKKLIQIKARRLSRRADFCRSDEADLVQEMTLHLIQRARQFDPTRGPSNPFVAQVIDHWIASMLRDRRRLKRAAGLNSQSLEGTGVTHEGKPASLRDVLHAEQVQGRSAANPEDEAARREVIGAVARIVGSLPQDLADICCRLPEQSHKSIQAELGLSRWEFDTAMARIRKAFEDAGLKDI